VTEIVNRAGSASTQICSGVCKKKMHDLRCLLKELHEFCQWLLNDLLLSLVFWVVNSPSADAWPVMFFVLPLRIPEYFSFFIDVFSGTMAGQILHGIQILQPRGSVSFMVFMIVSFPLLFPCTKRLKLACRWQWSTSGTFLYSLWQTFGNFSLIINLDGLPCLNILFWPRDILRNHFVKN